MLKLFSLDQFVELHNRSFRGELQIIKQDFAGDSNEREEKAEFINFISSFEKEDVKRIYNLANQILTRRR